MGRPARGDRAKLSLERPAWAPGPGGEASPTTRDVTAASRLLAVESGPRERAGEQRDEALGEGR